MEPAGQCHPRMMSSIVRRVIARGYDPSIRESPKGVFLYEQRTMHREELSQILGSGHAGGIALVLPTYVSRMSLAKLEESVTLAARRLNEAAAIVSVPLLFFVAIQWDDCQEREAYQRLFALEALISPASAVAFVGLTLPRAGKAASLNQVFGLAGDLGLAAVSWIDDDVYLNPACLANLYSRFLEKRRGAVGARKVPHGRAHRASRVLKWAKDHVRTPGRGYPHGCCMIVASATVAGGIPPRYVCDDDYFCFMLLSPGCPDLLADLEVLPTSVCHHTVGGPAPEIYRRIRRSLLTANVMMADFGPPKSAAFFREVQFFGLWPLAPFDWSRGFWLGILKLSLKSLYFAWFCAVGVELFLRGLAGRPLRAIEWSAYSQYDAPSVRFAEHKQG